MDDFRKGLIRLNLTGNIGCVRLKALLDKFKTPEGILKADINALKSVKGIGTQAAESIKEARADSCIRKELELINDFNVKVITLFDNEYPESLKTIYDPPVIIYVKGDLTEQDNLSIAVVGSRVCTYYGLDITKRIVSGLISDGVTIVSGLARGIDTAAHKAAIDNRGRTIAVLGNGLSLIYPSENKPLAEEIIKNGALLSEFPMQAQPSKQNFPRRNRIVSGLSKGVLVVEAGNRSGALITANLALEQGRDVFAVPGMAGRFSSIGTNSLIKQGAKLVEGAGEILEELSTPPKNNEAKEDKPFFLKEPGEKRIYDMLSDDPCDIDIIMQNMDMEIRKAKAILLNMELKGVIKQLPGKLYVRA